MRVPAAQGTFALRVHRCDGERPDFLESANNEPRRPSHSIGFVRPKQGLGSLIFVTPIGAAAGADETLSHRPILFVKLLPAVFGNSLLLNFMNGSWTVPWNKSQTWPPDGHFYQFQ